MRFVTSDEVCVMCGDYVPEGLMVCPVCSMKVEQGAKLKVKNPNSRGNERKCKKVNPLQVLNRLVG